MTLYPVGLKDGGPLGNPKALPLVIPGVMGWGELKHGEKLVVLCGFG